MVLNSPTNMVSMCLIPFQSLHSSHYYEPSSPQQPLVLSTVWLLDHNEWLVRTSREKSDWLVQCCGDIPHANSTQCLNICSPHCTPWDLEVTEGQFTTSWKWMRDTGCRAAEINQAAGTVIKPGTDSGRGEVVSVGITACCSGFTGSTFHHIKYSNKQHVTMSSSEIWRHFWRG